MHKILIFKAYEEAKRQRRKIGDNKPSFRNLSRDISNYILDIKGYTLCWKSFYIYHKAATKLLEKKNEDIHIKQLAIIEGLLNYVGFENYEDFVNQSQPQNTKVISSKSKKGKKKEANARVSVPHQNLFFSRLENGEKAFSLSVRLRIF